MLSRVAIFAVIFWSDCQDAPKPLIQQGFRQPTRYAGRHCEPAFSVNENPAPKGGPGLKTCLPAHHGPQQQYDQNREPHCPLAPFAVHIDSCRCCWQEGDAEHRSVMPCALCHPAPTFPAARRQVATAEHGNCHAPPPHNARSRSVVGVLHHAPSVLSRK